MGRNLFWLSDEQWARIEPHLPTDVRGEKMNQWEEEDRRRQGEMFTLIYGIWTFLFQVGVLALLSVIAWKLW